MLNPDEEYSHYNMENLPPQNQLPLSNEPIVFFLNFIAFLESTLNF